MISTHENVQHIESWIQHLDIGAFSVLLLGFSHVDAYVKKMKKLAESNFEAFWGEIGPLARSDFREAAKSCK